VGAGFHSISEEVSVDNEPGRIKRKGKLRTLARFFPESFDYASAVKKPMTYAATSDSVMPLDEFLLKQEAVFKAAKVMGKSAEYKMAFMKGMALCQALNSASVMQPGRASFYVQGDQYNFFDNVVYVLDQDTRRFFRASADFTRQVLRDVLTRRGEAELDDVVAQIDAIAHKRGLMRMSDLIHDSAEACSLLTVTERSALMVSKKLVLPPFNVVDVMGVVNQGDEVETARKQAQSGHAAIGAPVY